MTLKASVQYVLLSATAKYVQLTYQAYLDTRGQYPSYRDYVLSGDVARISFTKGFHESIGLSELTKLGISKSIAEQILLSEILGLSLGKSFKEQLAISDTSVIGFNKSTNEAVQSFDSRHLEIVKGIPENINIQNEKQVFSISKKIFDVVTVLDEAFVNKEGAQIQEMTEVTDSMTREILKGIKDTQAFNEQLKYQLTKGTLDSLFAQEAKTITINKILSDEVSFEDGISLFRGRLLQESFNSIDSQIIAFSKSLNDLAITQDYLTRNIGKRFEDISTASDKRIFALSKSGIAEQINATDTGFISTQNYSQYDYFANDYVGITINF